MASIGTEIGVMTGVGSCGFPCGGGGIVCTSAMRAFLLLRASAVAAAGLLAIEVRAKVEVFGRVGSLSGLFPLRVSGPRFWAVAFVWGVSI